MADKFVDDKELDVAMEAARSMSKGVYVHKLDEPFEYGGNTYTEIACDFGKLRGKDYLKIENEIMSTTGRPVIAASYSSEYLGRMAARASGVGFDVLLELPLLDFSTIRNKARSFLLRTEL